MSRLGGERGPQNRREYIAAFKRKLQDCRTSNSARLQDDDALVNHGDGEAGATLGAKHVGLSRVLARRKEAHAVVSDLMSSARGSYMLTPKADECRTLLGRGRPRLGDSAALA